MKKNYSIFVAILSPMIIGLFFAGTLYHGGSPGAKTGSPGDGFADCTGCHSGTPVDASGWITTDIPELGYEVGETYTITAIGTHAGVGRFGFELTAEDDDKNKVGQFIISADGQTQLPNGGASITHTSAGITPNGDAKTWSFQWTAPATDVGIVTFYAAFNAANNNSGTSGDVIYLSSLSVDESTVGIDNSLEKIDFTLSPNPSYGQFAVNHSLTFVNVKIFDMNGRSVYEEENYISNEIIDLSYLNKGIYMVQVRNEQNTTTKKILLK